MSNENPGGDDLDNLELLGPADVSGLSWDWAKPSHDTDSDLATVFIPLTAISLIIVVGFFANFIYKTRKRPPRRKTRLKGIHRMSMYGSKSSGV